MTTCLCKSTLVAIQNSQLIVQTQQQNIQQPGTNHSQVYFSHSHTHASIHFSYISLWSLGNIAQHAENPFFPPRNGQCETVAQ